MKIFLLKINRYILDILFPKKCLLCDKEGSWICEICFSKIKPLTDHVCPICEKRITPDGRTCLECKKKNHLSGMLVASSYKNELVAKAIHIFKYRFIEDMYEILGRLLIKSFFETNLPIPDLIVPIPLHSRRLRWRGFNQSELLAEYISKNLLPDDNIEIGADTLVRRRYTLPQMHIKNFKKRKNNIENAFEIRKTGAIQAKTILLVDDVATTGSTIFECARLLKKAGAKQVFAIVIARQEFKHNQ